MEARRARVYGIGVTPWIGRKLQRRRRVLNCGMGGSPMFRRASGSSMDSWASRPCQDRIRAWTWNG
jgi:hypothetical protein